MANIYLNESDDDKKIRIKNIIKFLTLGSTSTGINLQEIKNKLIAIGNDQTIVDNAINELIVSKEIFIS